MYKVLIVEDDPMVAMIHRQFLSRNALFEVVETCGDGASALEFIAKNEVDLAILDVRMPRLGGLELLHRLRERNDRVEVVLATAANDVGTLEEAFRLGVVDYLVKPFSYVRFQEALQKFVAKRGTLDEVTEVSQEEIDRFLGGGRQEVEKPPRPKGIQEKTVRIIADFLKNSQGEWLAGDEIAAQVKLSSVTARRYMNYLIQIGVAEGRMDYETGGRPRSLYRYKREGE